MRTILTLILAAAIAAPAAAQTKRCAEREMITERLTSGYGETFAGGGMRNQESIFEVWLSPENGTWTILMTTPDGRSCVMAAGTDWRDALPEKAAGIPG
jgi:hypothetical protein